MAQTAAAEVGNNVSFSFKDKLAYAAGDFGCNMSFALKSICTFETGSCIMKLYFCSEPKENSRARL